MTDEKLYEAYCKTNHLLTGRKTIRESHKPTSILKKLLNHG